jgi:hypothetical protein
MYNGNGLNIVAKLAPTNDAYYPYMIYDDQVQLFINKKGNIVSDKGQKVGSITYH